MNKSMLVGLFCILCFSAWTQKPMWKNFGIREGLYEPTINTFAQDKDGILWLGCQTGLVRFDGRNFVKIKSSAGEHPYITTLITGKDGIIWAGSRDGIWKFNPASKKFSKIHHKDSRMHINKICWNEDSTKVLIAGNGIWVLHPDKAFTQVKSVPNDVFFNVSNSGNKFITSSYNKIIQFDLKGNHKVLFTSTAMLNYALFPSGESLLAISETGLNHVDISSMKSSRIDFKVQWELTSTDSYNAVYIDLNKNIWINAYDTLYQFSSLKDQNPVKHFWAKENQFSLGRTLCFYMDRDKNIWANSEGKGISMLSAKMNSVFFNTYPEMDSRNVWATKYDAEKKIFYYGTEKGIQVMDLGKKAITRKTIPNPSLKTRFAITNIQDFDADHLVISTYGSSAWLLNKNTFKYTLLSAELLPKINAVYSRENGSVFVLCAGGLYIRDSKNNPFRFLGNGSYLGNSQTNNGDLYLGQNSILYYLKHNENNIKTLIEFKSNKQINSTVLCLHALENGNVFIGTINNGLFLYNKIKNNIEKINLDPDPATVYGISMIDNANLLLTTSNGIYLYNLTSQKTKCYNSNNLLPFNDFNQFGYFATNHMISLCGSEVMIAGTPATIKNIFIDQADIIVQNKFQIIHKLIIPAGEQSFSVNAGIGLKQIQHKPNFEYRLKGLDQKWHELDASGNISYNYVPPGNYILEIRMDDPNHILADQTKRIPVEIVPLWWQTFWFQAVIWLLSLILMIVLIRYFSRLRLNWKIRRMEAEQKVNNERMRISRELHDNVGSQLSYLITGLEASEMMLQKDNTVNLSRNLENLQESARESMQQLRDAIWALNKEEISAAILIERFSQWTSKMTEQHEIEINITSSIEQEIELDSLKTLNIFRILQEAVHNILKHAKASEAQIHFWMNDNHLRVSVNDNGCGFDKQVSAGNGLKNMRSRAKELGAEIEIDSQKGIGTALLLKIQINTPKG